MRAMGVDARVLNLEEIRDAFERHHPDTGVPTVYAHAKEHAPASCATTMCGDRDRQRLGRMDGARQRCAVGGARLLRAGLRALLLCAGEAHLWTAWKSYSRFPELVRLTKTEWNRATVEEHLGVGSTIVGPSVDIDLFCPRPRRDGDVPERPLRVAAMIRPQTPRRQAALTMEVLGEFARAHEDVEIVLFGTSSDDPEFLALPHEFAWRNAGMLVRPELASLMNEIDVFADFSSFQAMGLAALEAMASGAAVIVPKRRSTSFARHDVNSLVIDTSTAASCRAALERLHGDRGLLGRLAERATEDACAHHAEGAAHRVLAALFPSNHR